LSEFCGPNDIITPIGRDEEEKRRELGYKSYQNNYISLREYSLKNYINLLKLENRKKFTNHDGANFIKKCKRQGVEELFQVYF
jgi:hypothetical protein